MSSTSGWFLAGGRVGGVALSFRGHRPRMMQETCLLACPAWPTAIVIATRESRLALWQAEHVRALLATGWASR